MASDSRIEAVGEGGAGKGEGNASVFRCSRLEELFWLAGWAAEAPASPPRH